ncbi:2-amino-4-hydroxy-6-hydroxymethyldihydropteridine diphosphokinase, partial [bacterium]|nr:2-amino-4-hydroxy-6-hydroxymethyldihydropteridine diphosphokinase [bacterium]
DMTMDAFARFLKDVEKSLKRERTENKFGPRTIDLDIVVWNNAVIDDDVYTRGFLKKAVKFLIPDIF